MYIWCKNTFSIWVVKIFFIHRNKRIKIELIRQRKGSEQ